MNLILINVINYLWSRILNNKSLTQYLGIFSALFIIQNPFELVPLKYILLICGCSMFWNIAGYCFTCCLYL